MRRIVGKAKAKPNRPDKGYLNEWTVSAYGWAVNDDHLREFRETLEGLSKVVVVRVIVSTDFVRFVWRTTRFYKWRKTHKKRITT